MSDDRSFDDVMADIAIRSATNGGPGIVDVLEAIRASHTETKHVLSAHFTEARERDARLAKLETAAANSLRTSVSVIRASRGTDSCRPSR